MHHLMFIAICLIWGSNFILMKWAHAAFGPIGVGAGRVLGGAGVLWLILLMSKGRSRAELRKLSKAEWLALMLPVLVGQAYPFIMQPYLIGKHQDSAFFGMMISLVPLMTVIASVPMLRLLPTLRESAGVLFGLLCMGLLFRDGGMRGMPAGDLALAVLVPVSYAISNTFIKRRLSHMPPLFMTAVILGMTSVIVTPVGVAAEGVKEVSGAEFIEAVLVVAWLGIVGTGIATVMFYRLVQTHGPLYAGMIGYVVPIGAVVWGWADNENITATQLVALAGVFVSVTLVQWRSKAGKQEIWRAGNEQPAGTEPRT